MKNLKYIAFIFTLCFMFTNNVYAICYFGDTTSYLSCKVNSKNEVECSIKGSKPKYKFPDTSNITYGSNLKEVIESCEENATIYVVVKKNNNTSEYEQTLKGIYASTPSLSSDEVLIPTSLTKKMSNSQIEGLSTDLSSYNGRNCVYELGLFKYNCVIKNGKPVCTIGCSSSAYCGESYTFDKYAQSLTAGDFLKNGEFVCPGKSGDTPLTVCVTTVENGKDIVTGVDYICDGSDQKIGLDYNNDLTEKENISSLGKPYGDADAFGKDDFDTTNFCSAKVLSVFTLIGWVFFAVKILVPLILIIFGSIDLAKAIFSSKDDEIKKSVRTLIIRAVAGVIIFIIPSALNFIVTTLDNKASEVYDKNSGTFGKCTSCMLKPNQSICTTLSDD